MRIFKAKWFTKFAQKANIKDTDLKAAADLIDRGESSADDLGGHVFKLRFARPGEGKRGGYRFILFFRKGEKLYFYFAYPKAKLDNIEDDELRDYKALAKAYLDFTDEQITARLKDGRLKEIK
ncbi:hypothetical protein FACS189485_21460 [Spirochaetia bacterium]|nr:hypothetical protein FACS189485_21460 [Spirochaetia bacterium]